MSTYDGANIFGSGPHRIIVGGEVVAKKRTGYTGVDGVDSLIIGGRGYPVRIRGQLKGANRAAVETLIGTIETAMKAGPAALVDVDSNSHSNVELDTLRISGFMKQTSLGVFVEYEITGWKLY